VTLKFSLQFVLPSLGEKDYATERKEKM